MNQRLRGALITVVMIALFVFLLLLAVSGIAYMNDDPDSMLFPLSLGVFVVGALAAGILAVRMIADNPLIGGLIGAGIYLLMIAILSLFIRNGEAIAWLRVLLSILIATAASVAGAHLARPRAADPMKRRKHLERRYTS